MTYPMSEIDMSMYVSSDLQGLHRSPNEPMHKEAQMKKVFIPTGGVRYYVHINPAIAASSTNELPELHQTPMTHDLENDSNYIDPNEDE